MKVAFIIDGYFMRKRVFHASKKKYGFYYNGKNIRNYCKKHLNSSDEFKKDSIFRIYYYDSLPVDKKAHNPISKKSIDFKKQEIYKKQTELFKDIKSSPNFALRLGVAHIQKNWNIKDACIEKILKESGESGKNKATITPDDVKPNIHQKQVDMKIGIDIARMAFKKLADKIVVITGDSDMVPALKLARIEGLHVIVDNLGQHVKEDLFEHADGFKTFLKPSEQK